MDVKNMTADISPVRLRTWAANLMLGASVAMISVAGSAQAQRVTAAIETDMENALAAIDSNQYQRAIQLLTKLVGMPEHINSQQAQELLGVVRERNGQFAHARAEYKIYLEKYPDGPGARRVSLRLAGLNNQESPLPSIGGNAVESLAGTIRTVDPAERRAVASTSTASGSAQVQADGLRSSPPAAEVANDPGAFTTTTQGGWSQYYYLNQSSLEINNLVPSTGTTENVILQNALLSSLQVTKTIENDQRRTTLQFSGEYTADFDDFSQSSFNISEAYAELEYKSSGMTGRLGRHRLKTGGLLYRFDGASLTWPVGTSSAVTVSAGSPVYGTRDGFFGSGRFFVGASVELKDIVKDGELTFYAVEQRDSGLVDRRAIGAQLQVTKDNKWLFAALDYDLNFNEVNLAQLSGTYVFDNRSTLTARLTYMRSPILALSNALIGQTVTTIDELLLSYSESAAKGLALDRSTRTTSASLTFSGALNDTWQIALDGTAFYTAGNPASGGVAAVQAPGVDYFLSAQVYGSGIFQEDDTVGASAQYSNTSTSNLFTIGAYTQFPYSDELRLRPDIKIGYRDLKSTGGREIFVLPSLTATYKLSGSTSLEFELGGRWTNTETSTTSQRSSELFLIAGYRHDF